MVIVRENRLSRLWVGFPDRNPIETPLNKWFGLLLEGFLTREEAQSYVKRPNFGSNLEFLYMYVVIVRDRDPAVSRSRLCLFISKQRTPLDP